MNRKDKFDYEYMMIFMLSCDVSFLWCVYIKKTYWSCRPVWPPRACWLWSYYEWCSVGSHNVDLIPHQEMQRPESSAGWNTKWESLVTWNDLPHYLLLDNLCLGSMCVFILGEGDVSPDLLFILHCQLSSLHLLLSNWLILYLEGRIYIFLEDTNRAWVTITQ